MEPDHQYAEQVFEYGAAVDSPLLYFLTIIDINQKPIKIGYQSCDVTIQQLIKNYMEVTSYRAFHVTFPCFRILQHGPFLGQLAIQSNKLASYGLSLDSPCFKVYIGDEADLELQRSSVISKANQANNQNIIPVIIQVQGNDIKFKIDLNENLKYLKQRLIKSIQQLKNENPTNLFLMKGGLFIIDENALMKSYGITKDMKIIITIMKKHGCFSKSTNILTKYNKEVSIEHLKVGDEIISYNQTRKMFQIDKVNYILETTVYYYVIIELNDGTRIETTPNHLFLCQDDVYRSIDGQRLKGENLQIGRRLRLFNKVAQIQSIQNKNLSLPEVFYHLCVQNNHNFIVNGAIVHNLFVNVIIPNEETQRISIEPNQPISKIKQYFEQIYWIQEHSQKLLFAGKEIQDNQTMADRNIAKESNIYLKFKPTDGFNLLHPLTPILKISGQQKAVFQIEEGDGIVVWDSLAKKPSNIGKIVVSIVKKIIKEKIAIKLDDYDHQIVTSSDCYLELENGESMNVKDICYKFDHGQWPPLRKIDGTIYHIKQIAHQILTKPMQFYKLVLSSGQNYVAKSLIIHNFVVNIIVIRNNKRFRKLSIGAKSTDNILFLKNQVAERTGIPVHNLELTFNNQLLDNQAEIESYEIRTEHIIKANSLEKVSKSSLNISQLKQAKKANVRLNLQLSQSQKIQIDYDQCKTKTVEEIMRENVPNYESSYFFLFADLIIYPHEPLRRIQDSQEFGDNTIIVVKNEKVAFIQNMNIQGSEVKNQSNIHMPQSSSIETTSRIQVFKENELSNLFAAASHRIKSDKQLKTAFKQEKFYLPFLYFTSKKYNDKIFRYIKRFGKYRHQLNDNTSVYSIIKDLYINMNSLSNFIETCYFGMKHFKFSKFYQNQHTFYWHSFIIAYKDENNIRNDLTNHNGTLFVISSVNGKEISQFSVDPSRKQILFAPFTYFMVEKIQKYETYDKVWLSEISSPITFQKNIVLWVDDEPKNNIKVIKEILKKNDIEILQVTSTNLAQKWVKQFGWLLNWKGLQFKLISDMKRGQNDQAGVDLLQRLYKVHGISAQTLIFCGNKEKAQKNVLARNIPRKKFFSITIKEQDVKKFCIFKNT